MKIRLLVLPLLLMLVASLAACGGGGSQVPANAIATVNGTPITNATFNEFLAQASTSAANSTGAAPQPGTSQYTAMRNQVVAELVEIAEVEQEAPSEGVTVTPKDVSAFIANLVKTNYKNSETKFMAALKAQGLTMAEAQEQVKINLLATRIHDKVTASATVTTKEERAYYTSNIAQYSTPTRSVEHILVKQKSLADSIEHQLQNGASFARLAKKYSKDPGSAAQGGKYTATKGREVPAYDKVAFALKTGQLSAPVDATSSADGKYGWFIIKALGPVQGTTPFSQAQSQIESALLQQKQETLWQTWLSDLQKKYQGKVHYASGYAPPPTTAVSTGATLQTPTTG